MDSCFNLARSICMHGYLTSEWREPEDEEVLIVSIINVFDLIIRIRTMFL